MSVHIRKFTEPFKEAGMSRLDWEERQVISIILTLSFSCAALGGDCPTASGAVLRASGNVQVNGVGSREITTVRAGSVL